MKKSRSKLQEEFKALRTGHASAALFDKIHVDYYGAQTPLNQLATISIPKPRLVILQPWDKASIGAIEKAILSSKLSLNPQNDGKVLRINIPPVNPGTSAGICEKGPEPG